MGRAPKSVKLNDDTVLSIHCVNETDNQAKITVNVPELSTPQHKLCRLENVVTIRGSNLSSVTTKENKKRLFKERSSKGEVLMTNAILLYL